jgi:sulfofructose kinase
MAGLPDAKRCRILVVGYNAFDMIVPVNGLPVPDQKIEVSRLISGGGGPGATAALALARLGAAVQLLTPFADDVPGQVQRAELLAGGVDLSLSPIMKNFASPQAVILVDEARSWRTLFWSRGDLPELDASHSSPDLLDHTDLLYTDGHEIGTAVRLARAARERGLPVVMDAGSVRQGSAELVVCCTDVVSSRGFAPDLTGHSDPLDALRALRDLGPSRVAMTFGQDGVLGLEEDRPVPVAAFTIPVKDTTGAGDAYHAGYAFALAQGLGFGACLEWGAAVAGLKCRDWGGRRGLPDLGEVSRLLDTGRRRSLDGLLAQVKELRS